MDHITPLFPQICIGTSGYSYPDWREVFYPKQLPSHAQLEYYARHFPVVELNFSFYRIPTVKQVDTLLKHADGRLIFIVKAHQMFSHSTSPTQDLRSFLSVFSKMKQANMLGGILFQFPYAFHNTTANRDRLRHIAGELNDIPGIIEFRHNSWIHETIFQFLKELRLTFCAVDQPILDNLVGACHEVTSRIGYIRFHGRNKAKWWNHEKAWERYDYLYSWAELKEWIPSIRGMAEHTDRLYILFNNHYRAQAIQNAQLLMAFLSDVI